MGIKKDLRDLAIGVSLVGAGITGCENSNSNSPLESLETPKSHLVEMIIRHEGLRTVSYDDSLGVRTIGVGHNLEREDSRREIEGFGLNYDRVYSGKQAITREQAYALMRNDLEIAKSDARKYVGNSFDELPIPAQDVIEDMAFNLGYSRLSGFKKLRKELIECDFLGAANEMKDSKWYNQVGNRSKELVKIMKSCEKD
ncbi:MAG: glycoside hydrolase family protein [archaeon]